MAKATSTWRRIPSPQVLSSRLAKAWLPFGQPPAIPTATSAICWKTQTACTFSAVIPCSPLVAAAYLPAQSSSFTTASTDSTSCPKKHCFIQRTNTPPPIYALPSISSRTTSTFRRPWPQPNTRRHCLSAWRTSAKSIRFSAYTCPKFRHAPKN